MNQGGFHPTQDQLATVGAVEEALASLLPLARLHQGAEESVAVWSGLDALGAFSMSLSEAEGGVGLSAAEEALIVLSLGRGLAAPGVLAAIGAAHARPAADAAAEGATERVAAGYRRGDAVIALIEPDAKMLLLRETDGASLHAGFTVTRELDARNWLGALGEVELNGPPLARFDGAALLRLRLLDAAALAGVAQAALDMAVAYAQIRVQFGHPIGAFQAIKHHCANMAIGARCARDQVSFAAVALQQGRQDAALQVANAVLVAGQAALENAGKNIQIHGGIGFSDEADPHLVIKRAQMLCMLAGGMEAAAARIADIPINL